MLRILIVISFIYPFSDNTPIPHYNFYEQDFFEGDIILPDHINKNELARTLCFSQSTDDLIEKTEIWPNGSVPYAFSYNTYSNDEKFIITEKLKQLNDLVNDQTTGKCIFIHEATEREKFDPNINKVIFEGNTSVCASPIGQKRPHVVHLNPNNCFHSRTIHHEMLHTLGIGHEHSRPDRDEFIRIYFANIRKGKEMNFCKFPKWTDEALKTTKYDISSIMHYFSNTYAKTHREDIVTIEPRMRTGITLAEVGGKTITKED
ncbi:hypothetical protein SNEBB_008738, partial [Seison nebaliae]